MNNACVQPRYSSYSWLFLQPAHNQASIQTDAGHCMQIVRFC